MAIATTVADADIVTLREASEQLASTPYPASPSTIRRWLTRGGRRIVRHGRTDYVSYSDVLEVQRDEWKRQHGGT